MRVQTAPKKKEKRGETLNTCFPLHTIFIHVEMLFPIAGVGRGHIKLHKRKGATGS